jgi:hypothetical protein
MFKKGAMGAALALRRRLTAVAVAAAAAITPVGVLVATAPTAAAAGQSIRQCILFYEVINGYSHPEAARFCTQM